MPDESRVQDNVVLAQTLALNRADPDYYALELGSSVLGGGFYSTRLSIDLRKNAGLVYSVGSELQVGRTRGNYFVQYASDPQNVSKAADIVNREIVSMQTTPVPDEELGALQDAAAAPDSAQRGQHRRDRARNAQPPRTRSAAGRTHRWRRSATSR